MTVDPHLKHFLRLARQGATNPGASTYELGAHEFAELTIRYANGFDGDAWEGLLTFMELCRDHPETARDLLEGGVP